VVVAAPVTGVVERRAADDNRTRRHHLGEHLPAQPRRGEVRVLGDGLAEPLVQPEAAGPEPVAGTVIRAGDEAVERHRDSRSDLVHSWLLPLRD
jgi:hypothetical protein